MGQGGRGGPLGCTHHGANTSHMTRPSMAEERATLTQGSGPEISIMGQGPRPSAASGHCLSQTLLLHFQHQIWASEPSHQPLLHPRRHQLTPLASVLFDTLGSQRRPQSKAESPGTAPLGADCDRSLAFLSTPPLRQRLGVPGATLQPGVDSHPYGPWARPPTCRIQRSLWQLCQD